MSTNRIAAALAAGVGIGLVVAGLGIGLWWTLSKDNRTLLVVDKDREIEALLASAPTVLLEDGDRVVSVVSPRQAYGLEQWLGEDAQGLSQKGRGVQALILPSGHGGTSEEATVAELWLTRSDVLLRQWLSLRAEHWTAVGIKAATSSRERISVLAEANAMRGAIMRAVGSDADDNRWPLVIWRDGAGQLAVCHCYTPEALAGARQALGLDQQTLPETLQAVVAPPRKVAIADDKSASPTDGYPQLPVPSEVETDLRSSEDIQGEGGVYLTPSPHLPGDPNRNTQAQVRTTPVPTPRAKPVPREVNTAAPKAEKDAESLFY